MACLIKPSIAGVKGVLTLTTPERDRLIYEFDDISELLTRVKRRYAIGLHHNWHDYGLQYNDLFDFHMAGEDDLKESGGRAIPLVPMDACNFSPNWFHPGSSEKFWDVLFVARAVEFKGIPEFFLAIRKLFDAGHKLRVLFVCPVPPTGGPGSMRDVRQRYEKIFTSTEQELFTLLTTDFRYPFPFDLPTIAHFYRASKIFVHSAPDERRCRVAAYAWATGLPVVGMAPVGSVLSPALRREPFFYEISDYGQFPKQILAALVEAGKTPNFEEVQAEIASFHSAALLESHLARLFDAKGWARAGAGGWLENLDIRLGRHHGLPAGVNSLDQDLSGLLQFLDAATDQSMDRLRDASDPEEAIAAAYPLMPRALVADKVPRREVILSALRPAMRKIRDWIRS